MTTTAHSAIVIADGIHGIPAMGPYTNEAARVAVTGVAADIGKVCVQTDALSFWVLAAVGLWKRVAGPMPIHPVSGTTYTALLADVDALVQTTAATAVSLTIPPAATMGGNLAGGDTILFEQKGAGLLTLVAGSGVTLRTTSTLVSKGQYAMLSATYLGSDGWLVSGDRA